MNCMHIVTLIDFSTESPDDGEYIRLTIKVPRIPIAGDIICVAGHGEYRIEEVHIVCDIHGNYEATWLKAN
jgi:hypothetical protein